MDSGLLHPLELVRLFHSDVDSWGSVELVQSAALPAAARRLLVHQEHMTRALEAYHGCPVSIQVLAVKETSEHYAREILLRRQSDGQLVQWGIVRLFKPGIPEGPLREIREQRRPLGRVLMEHDVLTTVQWERFYEVTLSDQSRELSQLSSEHRLFGRTAQIFVDRRPVIDLLEIVVLPEVDLHQA